ncbi:MAG TPA: hypothetical protein VLF59_05285 [Candidatus Saccharimonadales bacterium]|nr:hypothetical protein [Candidatus Saccharimonadales bacterium]
MLPQEPFQSVRSFVQSLSTYMPLILKKSREELTKAERALAGLHKARTMDDAERAWQHLINALERVWLKSIANMQNSSRFQGWCGKYVKLRRSDDLLAYLVNARGAYEHTIRELVGAKFEDTDMANLTILGEDGSYLRLFDVPEMRAFLDKAELHGDTIVHVETEKKATTDAKIMQLHTIYNRGRTYPVPLRHLGKPLEENDSITIGGLGIKFYKGYIESVEAEFQNENI